VCSPLNADQVFNDLTPPLTPTPSPEAGRGEQALTPTPSHQAGRGEQALTPTPSPEAGRGEQALTPTPSPQAGRGEQALAMRRYPCPVRTTGLSWVTRNVSSNRTPQPCLEHNPRLLMASTTFSSIFSG